MFWTKRKLEYNENKGLYQATGEYEVINYSKFNAVPDGDGFEIDMNGIEFIDYIEDKENYEIKQGKLERKFRC